MNGSECDDFAKMQSQEDEMSARLEAIQTGEDFKAYMEDFLEKLSSYRQLSEQSVDEYLFIIAGLADSPAAVREIKNGEPLWRSIAKVLIYSLDRE
jgi:hypothetical protein